MQKPVDIPNAAISKGLTHFLNQLRSKMMASSPSIGFRSGGYIEPSVFYNHQSHTFMKNRRKDLKRSRIKKLKRRY